MNDKQKTEIVKKSNYELIRIHTSEIPDDLNINTLMDNSYIPDYSIEYRQRIINKEYFKKYIDSKGKDKLRKYVNLLLKFIRTFQPEFPEYPQKEEFKDIVNKIQNYDLSNIRINNTMFNGSCSLVGINYLKSNFKSYWKSSYKKNISPVEV